MSIAGAGNAWWWDVLENGPASRWAGYFDVDWGPPQARLRNTVLLPILGDHYGRVLEAGELVLARDGGRLRAEDERVFADTHALVLSWVERGVLDGLRIDHPDGLYDPGGYFERLLGRFPVALLERR